MATNSSNALAWSEFEECCKIVGKTVRADKGKWLKEKGTVIQGLADKVSIRAMFCKRRFVCKKWCPQTTNQLSKDGQILGKKEESLERLTGHFKQLMNSSKGSQFCS